jgi:hypothetical protein
MPREQRVQLKKAAVEETPLGTIESKPMGRVDMPFVSPEKSLGQSLAEGLGVAAKGAASIIQQGIDEDAKVETVTQKFSGISAGKREAIRILDNLPDKVRTAPQMYEYLSTEWNSSVARLRDENKSIHSSFLDAFNTTGMNRLAAKHEEILQLEEANKVYAVSQKAKDAISERIFLPNVDGKKLYSDFKTYYKGKKNNADIGKEYVTQTAAIIKQYAEDHPEYDWQTAIDNILEITTDDGVELATNKEYGKVIDTLISSLTTLTSARATADEKANTKASDDLTKKALILGSDPNTNPKDLVNLRESILNNQDIMAVGDLQTSLEVLDGALSTSGFATNTDNNVALSVSIKLNEGTLTADYLTEVKRGMTQADWLAAHKQLGAYNESVQTGANQALATNMAQQLANLKQQVGRVDRFGSFLEKLGPDKVTLANQLWSEWAMAYRVENPENPFPSISDQTAAATRIKSQVEEAFKTAEERKLEVDLAIKEESEVLKNKIESAGGEKEALMSGAITPEEYKKYKQTEEPEEEGGFIDDIVNIFK